MSALNIIFSEKAHVHPKDLSQPRISTLKTGPTAQLNETESTERAIVLSLRRTVKTRSNMMDIMVSTNGLPHQEAVNTFAGVC